MKTFDVYEVLLEYPFDDALFSLAFESHDDFPKFLNRFGKIDSKINKRKRDLEKLSDELVDKITEAEKRGDKHTVKVLSSQDRIIGEYLDIYKSLSSKMFDLAHSSHYYEQEGEMILKTVEEKRKLLVNISDKEIDKITADFGKNKKRLEEIHKTFEKKEWAKFSEKAKREATDRRAANSASKRIIRFIGKEKKVAIALLLTVGAGVVALMRKGKTSKVNKVAKDLKKTKFPVKKGLIGLGGAAAVGAGAYAYHKLKSKKD